MPELKRTLGVWSATSFLFLNLVNTGIFFGVAIGASVAGAGSLIAWVGLAILSLYLAMCFAELTTMFPRAGGVYEFAKQAYGRFPSFLIGWTTWVMNSIATALLVAAAVTYLIPDATLVIGALVIPAVIARIVLSLAIIAILNLIAYRGGAASDRFLVLLALATVVLILMAVVPGLRAAHTSNFSVLSLDWLPILLAAFLLSETFYGWESISFMAEEVIDPDRTIPRALLLATSLVALLALAVAFATIGVLGAGALASGTVAKPLLAMLAGAGAAPWLLLVANACIVLTFLGNAAGSTVGAPRLLMALARDKLFIEQFADVHPTRGTPHKAILLQAIVTIAIAVISTGAYELLLALVAAPSLLIYISAIVLVPWFRWTRPEHPRPFKAVFGSFLPLLAAAALAAFIVAWIIGDPESFGQLRLLGSFLLFSIPIYLLLTYFYDPDALIRTMNRFAGINLWLENVLLPKRLRREILELLPDVRNKRLLEFGSGVGTLTAYLAERVGREGTVYAIELSEGNAMVLRKRMDALRHAHVRVIHDPHLVNRVHPDVREVDIIVGVGNLSYIQDVRKVLHEMNALLPIRGHICFIEYVDFFWFLPNPRWLNDTDEIRKLFAECGFAVTVRRRRGLLWNYLYITGIKETRDVPYI